MINTIDEFVKIFYETKIKDSQQEISNEDIIRYMLLLVSDRILSVDCFINFFSEISGDLYVDISERYIC